MTLWARGQAPRGGETISSVWEQQATEWLCERLTLLWVLVGEMDHKGHSIHSEKARLQSYGSDFHDGDTGSSGDGHVQALIFVAHPMILRSLLSRG